MVSQVQQGRLFAAMRAFLSLAITIASMRHGEAGDSPVTADPQVRIGPRSTGCYALKEKTIRNFSDKFTFGACRHWIKVDN